MLIFKDDLGRDVGIDPTAVIMVTQRDNGGALIHFDVRLGICALVTATPAEVCAAIDGATFVVPES